MASKNPPRESEIDAAHEETVFSSVRGRLKVNCSPNVEIKIGAAAYMDSGPVSVTLESPSQGVELSSRVEPDAARELANALTDAADHVEEWRDNHPELMEEH